MNGVETRLVMYDSFPTTLVVFCEYRNDRSRARAQFVNCARLFCIRKLRLRILQVSGDLTEVTELSHLTESPSLLEIFTPEHHNPPPHTVAPSPNHTYTVTPSHTEDVSTESTIGYYHHSPQGRERGETSSCVRRLDLTHRQPTGHTFGRTWEEEEEGETRSVSKEEGDTPTRDGYRSLSSGEHRDTSLLALDLRLHSLSCDETGPNSSSGDLFTTAIEPSPNLSPLPSPSPPPSHSPPPSPSSSTRTPFLAESLKRIELRRRRKALQENSPVVLAPSPNSPPSHTPSPVSHSHPTPLTTTATNTSSTLKRQSPVKRREFDRQLYLKQPLTERLALSKRPQSLTANPAPLSPLDHYRTSEREKYPLTVSCAGGRNCNRGESVRLKIASSRANVGQGEREHTHMEREQKVSRGVGATRSLLSSVTSAHTRTEESSLIPEKEEKGKKDDTEEEEDEKEEEEEGARTSLVADASFVSDSRTRIPPRLQKLTNQELRDALVGRGEQPGPVTDTTRCAYLMYLAKLEAGVQPAGNTGYKGEPDVYPL